MRAVGLLNIVFSWPQFLLLQAARKTGQRGHLLPEPLKTDQEAQPAGATEVYLMVTDPDKREGLKAQKSLFR